MELGLNRRRALGICLGMIFSENRYTLFRISGASLAIVPGQAGMRRPERED